MSLCASAELPTCLVLGGRGFIGSHLVDALLARGHRVRCFDLPQAAPARELACDAAGLEFIDGDFGDEEAVAAALAGCELCYHLVCSSLPQSSNADPVGDIERNLLATLRFLNQAVKAGVRKVIFASSGGTVYGDPRRVPVEEGHGTDPRCSYGIAKLAIEKYLELYRQLHGLEYTVLRMANPFGERQRIHASQGAIAVFLGKVLRGETVEVWGDGSVVRDFIYIADVVAAFVAAQAHQGEERIFNIGSGRGHSLNAVLDSIASVTGLPVLRRHLPGRAFDVPDNVLCIERARRCLGWAPEWSFEAGLARFAQWLRQNP